MNIVIGTAVVVASVAGGFVLSHGELRALWQPYEVLIIVGAALGAFVIANPPNVIRGVLRALPSLLQGNKYDRALFLELLALLHEVFAKARKQGLMSLENDVEAPDASELFSRYPQFLAEHRLLEFLTDYLRLMISGNLNPMELENLMDVELESHRQEAELPGGALGKVADALPGFGIVAAVLGIVITMGALGTGSTEEIGKHVAAALVGTFLGILFAYGFVAPLANALEHKVREEEAVYGCIKTSLLASLQGYPPSIAVEFGRKTIHHDFRPGFSEVEERVKQR